MVTRGMRVPPLPRRSLHAAGCRERSRAHARRAVVERKNRAITDALACRPDRRNDRPAPRRKIALATAAESLVYLQAPAGVSGAHGTSGTYHMVGADGLIAVRKDDAATLIAAEFAALLQEKCE